MFASPSKEVKEGKSETKNSELKQCRSPTDDIVSPVSRQLQQRKYAHARRTRSFPESPKDFPDTIFSSVRKNSTISKLRGKKRASCKQGTTYSISTKDQNDPLYDSENVNPQQLAHGCRDKTALKPIPPSVILRPTVQNTK